MSRKYLFGNLSATLKASFSIQVSKNKVTVALLTGLGSGMRMFINVTEHNQPIRSTKSPITADHLSLSLSFSIYLPIYPPTYSSIFLTIMSCALPGGRGADTLNLVTRI